MKKNYIAPSTQMATFASMGLMDNITIGISSASGGATPVSTSSMEDIQ